jgi:Mg2+ and Co2+ transporter CorA
MYSTKCVTKARELTNELSTKIDDDPESINLTDIISAKQHGQKLSSIVEDQKITLKLVPRINWSEQEEKIDEEIRNLIDYFGFLSISVNHLEDKIRELQLQYQLILQEKGNKRLNALTIIQAIFVP